MRNYFTIIWVAFVLILLSVGLTGLYTITKTPEMLVMIPIIFGIACVLLLYCLLFGLIFPLLYDLLLDARKLDKKRIKNDNIRRETKPY